MAPLKHLFDHPSDMEPLLPTQQAGLESQTLVLIRSAEQLRAGLHPQTRQRVAELVRSMNSYYSNLIEGHRTRPGDIDAAIRKEFSKNPEQRSLQIQHVAHMEVQAEMEAKLPTMTGEDICSTEFLCWLHEEFYKRLPEEFCRIEDEKGRHHEVQPGKLRQGEVSVGRHVAPTSKKLDEFLGRFASVYGPLVTTAPTSLMAAAAAHHRLVWIHPFQDGNGRVTRLFTQAWFVKAGVDSNGLWILSRGMARQKSEYQVALANADQKRITDFDGRGYLSQRYLDVFCRFFLDTAIDQVTFMQKLLALDGVLSRIVGYAKLGESSKELPKGTALLLREIFLRGRIARGEVARIIGASPRTAQKVIGELLGQELIGSDTPKGLLNLKFPGKAASFFFPSLYPAGAE